MLRPIFAFVSTKANRSVKWAMDGNEKHKPECRFRRGEGAQKLEASEQLIRNDLLFEFLNPDSLKPYPNNPVSTVYAIRT
jgi:hypothetical protein